MDVLADLLMSTRARGGVFTQMVLDPPWSLRIADGAVLALATVVRGSAWVVRDDAPPARIGPGDVCIIRGAVPYTVADDPATAPQLLVTEGGRCQAIPGAERDVSTLLATRTYGHDDAVGPTVLVSGTYRLDGDVSRRLLAALPSVLVVPADAVPREVTALMLAEIARDEPGQQVVLDRWLDLALVTVLRAWFVRPESRAPGWYSALADPVVGQALRLVHGDPAHAWTVAGLAERTHVSRAALARRFTALVGEPPMAYVTEWRMALAGDLLRQSDVSVETVARRVGYSGAFAFSKAFTRSRGLSPSAHRRSPAPGRDDLAVVS